MTPEDERRMQELEGLVKRYRSRIAELKADLELAQAEVERLKTAPPIVIAGVSTLATATDLPTAVILCETKS